MAKPNDEMKVIKAIGSAGARTVAAVAKESGLDRRKVQRILNGMTKGDRGDFYVVGTGVKAELRLGYRGRGRLRFPVAA